jgi:serine/threonine protein kinase/tetratricopeptide (TPR) repeat protein
MSSPESKSGLVMELAEEFLARCRKGERPVLKEYLDRHPELAEEIREVFPAMALMENIALSNEGPEEGPATASSKAPPPALRQLGDFRILREIGRGGMGVVYEAEQVSLGRHVALKVLPHKSLLDGKQQRRFEREAKAAAKLHHTNIVPVFGVGEHEGLLYYVMQFIQGLGLDAVLEELQQMQPDTPPTQTLQPAGRMPPVWPNVSAAGVARSLLTGNFVARAGTVEGPPEPSSAFAPTLDQPANAPERAPLEAPVLAPSTSGAGRLSDSFTVSSSSLTLSGSGDSQRNAPGSKQTLWHSVANIGRQVADALEYAHKQGVLHRDIKPSNLLLDVHGTVWVADFGLAKVSGPGADGDNLTHTGDILGTLRYMPPEAFEGKSDARGDLYALGLTLYELLTLRPAFAEKDRHKLIKQVTTQEPAPLDRVRGDIPRDLVTVVHKAIDRDPQHRYASAGELAADLQRFLDDEPVLARRQTNLERYRRWARRHPGIAVLGGVLSGVLVLVTAASLVVAGRMADLASSEAQSASNARAARDAAVAAQESETKQRTRAELALKKADENYARARAAVNDYLTAVSEDDRLKVPGLQGLRVQLLQSALPFYQEFLKERGSDPTLRKELAGVYFKVGEIYRELGQQKAADQSLNQARRLYEQLAAAAPGNPEFQHGLAMSLERSGKRMQSITMMEKLVRPDDSRYQAELGQAYTDFALKQLTNDPGRQLQYLRKALAVHERLVQLRPDDSEARLALSGSLNNIAVRLRGKHEAQSIELLRRASRESEAAYRLRPGHPQIVRFLGTELHNLADAAQRLGLVEEALAAARRRAEVFDRNARDNPTLPGNDAAMVKGYTDYVNLLREVGRLDEADQVAARARERLAEATEDTLALFAEAWEFHQGAVALAQARARSKGAELERALSEAVLALRRYVLAGFRDENWLRTNLATEPLRERADFQEVLARTSELAAADAVARNATASGEERLTARQKSLATLERLAEPLGSARFARRLLAQARQELAKALLEVGRVDEARQAFATALTALQQLVQEAPANEQLRADLAKSQSAAGDLLAAAGKLGDAAQTWDKALATLQDGLRGNPNSIPYQTALADLLVHVADQYGKTGLWEQAADHFRRAFKVQEPTFATYYFAMALLQTGDDETLRALTDKVAARLDPANRLSEVIDGPILLIGPDAATRYPDAVQRLTKMTSIPMQDETLWCQGLAHLRLGEDEKAIQVLTRIRQPFRKLPALALALQRCGKTKEARTALLQADRLAEGLLRNQLAADALRIPTALWADWALCRKLRQEAHQAILGDALPASPLEHLFHARVLWALDRPEQSEAEFAAAVAVHPENPEGWLTRARVYANLGLTERMLADLQRAQQVAGTSARVWCESGRLLAELGQRQAADQAFTRAATLARGDLNLFLNSQWWKVGPYPEQLDLTCPPEANPDPSRSVAAVGEKRELRWKPLSVADLVLKTTQPPGKKTESFYALAFVQVERERTATLKLQALKDARLWVNGRLAFDGFSSWQANSVRGELIPLTLKAGRNTVLVKVAGPAFVCVFQDNVSLGKQKVDLSKAGDDAYARQVALFPRDPRLWIARGVRLGELGRGDETAQAFARASALAPKSAQVWKERGRAYAQAGKWRQAADDFAQALDLAPPTLPNGYDWWNQRHGVDDVVLRHPELFDRLTQLRPRNVGLVVRQVRELIGYGEYAKAAALQERVATLLGGNVFARQVLALLRLAAADRVGYRQVCRELLPLYQNRRSDRLEPMTVLSLLTPEVGVDRATLEQWSPALANNLIIDQLAYVLTEYRQGNHERVLRRLALFARARGSHQASLYAVYAAALARLGRYGEAAEALRKAREEEAKFPRPGPNGLPADLAWWEIVRASTLIEEAEHLIPEAPPRVAQVALSPEDQVKRRQRKARSDELSTQAALAIARFESGDRQAAEDELRALCTARAKLAAEEPANPDYQIPHAEILLALGHLLLEDGDPENGRKFVHEGLALRKELQMAHPRSMAYSRDYGLALFNWGTAAFQKNQSAEGIAAHTQAAAALEAALKEEPANKTLAVKLRNVEWFLGAGYANFYLWEEAAEWMTRAARRLEEPDLTFIWVQAAGALAAAGKREDARLFAQECQKRLELPTQAVHTFHRLELAVLLPSPTPLPEELVHLAEKTARTANIVGTAQLIALCQFRAGAFEEAIRLLDTPESNRNRHHLAVLAMAHYKLGHVDQARQWLDKARGGPVRDCPHVLLVRDIFQLAGIPC